MYASKKAIVKKALDITKPEFIRAANEIREDIYHQQQALKAQDQQLLEMVREKEREYAITTKHKRNSSLGDLRPHTTLNLLSNHPPPSHPQPNLAATHPPPPPSSEPQKLDFSQGLRRLRNYLVCR